MDRIALIVAITGALSWGIFGIFGVDLIALAFGGSGTVMSRIIYTIVGLAGIWCVSLLFKERDAVKDD